MEFGIGVVLANAVTTALVVARPSLARALHRPRWLVANAIVLLALAAVCVVRLIELVSARIAR